MSSVVVIVDVQNSYYSTGGAMRATLGDLMDMDLVGRLNRAGPDLVRLGARLWTRHCYNPDYSDAPPEWRLRMAEVMASGGLVRGSWDAALADGLVTGAEEVVLDKTQYDAFAGTDLAARMERGGVTTLYLAGSLTNVCVAATARSALGLGLTTTVLTDLVTARDPVAHREALTDLDRSGARLAESHETAVTQHAGRGSWTSSGQRGTS